MAEEMEGKKETVGTETLITLENVVQNTKTLVEELEKKLQTICSPDDKDNTPEEKIKEIPEYFNNIRTQYSKIRDINSQLESLLHRIEL